ncbi:MAG TPA: glycosyltransferase family 2 protein [Thermoanaerobaculia bacterium]|jgi:GT2 family glycosyltransferase|nr:glycosyltransferase family 2 protein [Thermoanaerobaculia bacterium]
MNDVSVIVLDIDGGDMLRVCLDSIAAQTFPPHEVIVFDNGSRTPVAQRIAFRHGLHLFRNETNLGFAGGNNAAYRHASGQYIALINNDVILDRDWLATVVAACDADPKLAAVQTILRRDENTIDGAGIDISDGTFRQIRWERGRPARSSTDDPANHGGRDARAPRAWGVSATAALYRREALGDVIFDEMLFAYYEDVDLCARLHEAGWRIEVLPLIKATHRGSQSAAILGRDAIRLRTRNRYLVARRHRGVGRISALLLEDLKLALRGRTSFRGMWQGLFTR